MAIDDKKIPLVELFPKIINRKVFLNQTHPRMHPEIDRDKYVRYWREEKRRCIEGYWAKEKRGHWRWMNPDLYHYINHWTIKDSRKDGPEVAVKPTLRDTEWIITTAWTEAIGFSGFTKDDKYNCSLLLKKYYQFKRKEVDKFGKKILLDNIEIEELERDPWLRKDDGTFKEFVPAGEYLKRHFEKPMGLPIYHNQRKDLMLLGSRGIGKSYSTSAIIGREFTMNGRKYLETDLFTHGGEIGSVLAGAVDRSYAEDLYDKVIFGLDNYSGAYSDSQKDFPPPFYKERKGTFTSGDVVSHEYEVYYPEGGRRIRGSKSQMFLKSFGKDADAAVGQRKSIIVVEEVGLLDNLITVSENNKNVMIRNGRKIGSNFYIGTGGNILTVHGSRAIFYNPVENGFLEFKNEWENGESIGLFIPVEYTLSRYKDENGNTRLKEAREFQLKKRFEIAQSSNSEAFTKNQMFEPIKPSDMFLSDKGKIFSQYRITERLAELSNPMQWREGLTFGEIVTHSFQLGDVTPKFKPFVEANPIIALDTSSMDDVQGSIIFYDHPPQGLDFSMRGSRYRVVYDPIKVSGEGTSLASILVYDTLTEDIVAEFIGRRQDPSEIHDIAISLGLYYCCPVFAELNVPGFLNHAKRRGVSWILYPTPLRAISKTTKNPKIKPGEVGVVMTAQIKSGAITYAKSLMFKKDGEGRDLYNKNRSLRFLEEAAEWDGIKNSDHMSAFLLLALWEEEESEITYYEENSLKQQYEDFMKVVYSMGDMDIQKEILGV